MSTEEKSGYERQDVNVRRLLLVTLAVLLLIVVVIWAMNEYFFMAREDLVYETVLKPESAEWRELVARETETLNSYKVIDAQKGIYQIPIERAMDLLAREHYLQTATAHREIKK
jgi:DNA-binding LytR/AlgR family response regulator